MEMTRDMAKEYLLVAQEKLSFWQNQVDALNELVNAENAPAPEVTRAKARNSRKSNVSAKELSSLDSLEDAIRYTAIRSKMVFRPTYDKVPLIESGFIEDSRYGGNKLNRVLNEMPDMHNERRNKWVLVDSQPPTVGIFADGSAEEAEEYEERLTNNDVWFERATRPIVVKD